MMYHIIWSFLGKMNLKSLNPPRSLIGNEALKWKIKN